MSEFDKIILRTLGFQWLNVLMIECTYLVTWYFGMLVCWYFDILVFGTWSLEFGMLVCWYLEFGAWSLEFGT